jgi:RinA family phage transcriptional activator
MGRQSSKMKKSVKKLVDQMLFDYPKIDGYVDKRREEIQYPYIEQDENVGGGKAKNKISKPIENMIISLDEDKILTGLIAQKNAIYKAFKDVDPTIQPIIKRYYFYNQARYKNIYALLNEFHVSKATFYRELDRFMHDILDNLQLNFLEWKTA